MANFQLKHTNIQKLNVEELKNFLQENEYREFIEYFLLENKKGENGLIFKELLNQLSSDEESIIKEEIEKFNIVVDDNALWRKPAIEIYESLLLNIESSKKEDLIESKGIYLFLLFSMNYVFFSYANKDFRRFIGVKKRSLINSLRIK
ncbi:hypothetical protein [Paenisporosarcina antarctica]|uniref:Uncharacterized protein n=1 Tax=Paenisporosarcina antarctica TaxID=417367 RepID=A0A4P7A1D3_9BACL|nr:hypothetical protein [Paenisporosarcina antarctica]QBP42711.1 hypothetical protein E2636_16875 [Paenisporosarcina antarctica]